MSKKPSKPSGTTKTKTESRPWAAALVLAAGAGKRLGVGGRKGLLKLGDRPLYAWSVEAFLKAPFMGQVVVVVHSEDLRQVGAACQKRFKDPRLKVVAGGAERQDSVRFGLQSIDPHMEVILVHDAARPFINASLIKHCAVSARLQGGAVACVPVKDSVKLEEAGGVLKALPREKLRAAQTPQAYQAHLLREAHAQALLKRRYYTDEAGLCEAAGTPSVAVASYYENFKITTPEDLPMAKRIIGSFDFDA
jgi:2-C-methyl-D-erythritol 4-phosphate cytidylyltransferase